MPGHDQGLAILRAHGKLLNSRNQPAFSHPPNIEPVSRNVTQRNNERLTIRGSTVMAHEVTA
jgi:hypothetical protein